MDQEFLADQIKKCSISESEFDQRVKDCMEDIVAVSGSLPTNKAEPGNDDNYFENMDSARVPREVRCLTSCLP
eukprot:8354893-Heterocapsa_arctica.AAC.1